LVGKSVGWLVGWSVGWLVGWSFGWLVGWLVGWSVGCHGSWFCVRTNKSKTKNVERTKQRESFDDATVRQTMLRNNITY
jgi:hypothetical protein